MTQGTASRPTRFLRHLSALVLMLPLAACSPPASSSPGGTGASAAGSPGMMAPREPGNSSTPSMNAPAAKGTSPTGAAPTTNGTTNTTTNTTTAASNAPGVQPETTKDMKTEKATFAAGCFWGVEATFRKMPGVIDAFPGYTGGKTVNPTYKDVCTDLTGHAEAVEITFDPTKVTYQQLVDVFFKMHDPTQVNRQGPDVGTQYRTAIFYHSPEQKMVAEATIKRLTEAKKFRRPIATQLVEAQPFYKAEEYHQRYLEKHGLDNCHLPPADD